MKDKNTYIKNRLKNAKDIHNVINNLKDNGYTCIYGNNKLDNGRLQEFYTITNKKENVNITIYYQTKDFTEEYKQNIDYILF